MLNPNYLHRAGLMLYEGPTDPATDPNAYAKAQAAAIKTWVGDTNDTFEQADLDKFKTVMLAKLKDLGIPMGVDGTIFNWQPFYEAIIDILARPWLGKKYTDFTSADFEALGQDRWLRIALVAGAAPTIPIGGNPLAAEQPITQLADLAGLMGKIVKGLLDPANWVRGFALVLGLILVMRGLNGMQS